MPRSIGAFLVVAVWGVASGSAVLRGAGELPGKTPASPGPAAPNQAVITEYCVGCHNDRTRSGGLVLDRLDLANVGSNAEIWEKVVRKLRVGVMPPKGARRPSQATYEGLIASLETELDRAAAADLNPGRPLLHRLNRSEYANAIRDLIALDVDVSALLPPDDSGHGFDNMADLLGVSPVLLEAYLSAASEISGLALGDPETGLNVDTYRVPPDLSQNQHIEGLPIGTIGGLMVHHVVPLDGDYVIKVKLNRSNLGGTRGLENLHHLEIAVDGERVYLGPVGGPADLAASLENPTIGGDAIDARLQVRLPLKAGARAITAAFVEKSATRGTRRLQLFQRSTFDAKDSTGDPHIDTLSVSGPFNPSGPGDTATRRRVLVCRPSSAADEEPCARKILSTLAYRAYRGQIAEADVQRLMDFYRAGRRVGKFETGIQRGLERVLASPKFVFRAEHNPTNEAPGAVYRISDLELASRLSFFLWSSIPDDELLESAKRGKLRSPASLEREVRRMLADPRAEALVTNFAGQWLQLRNLRSAQPNSYEFPDFDDNLRRALQRETELFLESVLREDRSVVDLLTADYTFLNERLARHYGIPYIYGSQFRRVTLTDETRKGLLGKGAILTVTSHSDRTSPVVRGKWVLENFLGTPPPPPPPDVPALKGNEEGKAPRSMREQVEEHRRNPPCAGCHRLMDPIGFALENFDAVGAWRTRDAGVPIDASGELADGTPVNGAVTLRQALVNRSDVFVRTVTEKLLTYALGRGLDHHDMPVVRAIVRDSAPRNYRLSSIVLGIVSSAPFQMRTKTVEKASTVARVR
jgi:Protein of unknown function (DUF1592)/Protein of unknown function (DUF1588)/Protein of unknown function (DUF1587)/Protein of unknown function (DUF1585)/Protein of unknown function (DUF1595)/Planctomycete cytochrome C